MQILTKVLDEQGTAVFQGQTRINGEALLKIAETKEAHARQVGSKTVANGIAFYGRCLIEEMKKGELGDALDNAAIQVALMACLYDSIYGVIPKESFLASDLQFTMYPGGIVKYDRLRATD